jgi:hypothetical protein
VLQGRLDLFFLCLAALMFLNLIIFLWVASRYEYKAVEHIKRVVLPRSLQVGAGAGGIACAEAGVCVLVWGLGQ